LDFHPKANGYQALHTTVMSHTGKWVEVQIRSARWMPLPKTVWLLIGCIKKTKSRHEQGVENWLAKVKQLLQNQQDISSPILFRG
jgi:GTP pyrophosphokinase